MQALKDAGIVLAGLTLLVSVQIKPADPADSPESVTLTPQTEAARALPAGIDVTEVEPAAAPHSPTAPIVLDLNEIAVPAVTAARARVVQRDAASWVFEMSDVLEAAEIDIDVAERCSEILVMIRNAAEATGHEALKREARTIVESAPCPRA